MTDPQVAMLQMGGLLFDIMLGFPISFTLIAMGVGLGSTPTTTRGCPGTTTTSSTCSSTRPTR